MNHTLQHFLVGLSHAWSPFVWLSLAIFVVLTYRAKRSLNQALTRVQEVTLQRLRSPEAGSTDEMWKEAFQIALQRAKRVYGTYIFLILTHLFVLGVAMLHLGCVNEMRESTVCKRNLISLGNNMGLYSQDYDEHLPPAKGWFEALSTRDKSLQDALLHCPSAISPFSYGMNQAVGGLSYSDLLNLEKTPLLFEADAPRRSFVGGEHDVALSRHSGMTNIFYPSMGVRPILSTALNSLNWKPKAP